MKRLSIEFDHAAILVEYYRAPTRAKQLLKTAFDKGRGWFYGLEGANKQIVHEKLKTLEKAVFDVESVCVEIRRLHQ